MLLLLDGHVRHTKSLEVIELARKNGVIMLCFPPHCTHRLQPLDVTFMKPLSVYYDKAASNWLRSHPGRVITVFQISEIFGEAYVQAATMSTTISGWRKCEIWLFNQNRFKDSDFIAAETTNIPIVESDTTSSQENAPLIFNPETCCSRSLIDLNNSVTTVSSSIKTVCHNLTSSFENASPTDILPKPAVEQKEPRKNYRRGKTTILTSSLYKKELKNLKRKEKKKYSNSNDLRLKKNAKKNRRKK